METYWVWEYGLFEKNPKRQDSLNPETTLEVVKAADAQATIAELMEALECVLTEKPLPSGEYVHLVSCNGDRRKPAGTVGVSCSCRVGKAAIAALQARVQVLEAEVDTLTQQEESWESQLTQRTAECDALKLVNDTHMKTVMKLSHVVEQRTAELEAATRERDHAKKMEAVQKEVADNQTWHVQRLRTELERVRGEVNTLNQLLRDKGLGQGEIDSMAADLEELATLRTLIAALPKVEGEIRVNKVPCGFPRDKPVEFVWCVEAALKDGESWDLGTFDTLEEVNAYDALLQHRQGMEG